MSPVTAEKSPPAPARRIASDPGGPRHHSSQPLALGRRKRRSGTGGGYVPKSSAAAASEAGSTWPRRVLFVDTFRKNCLPYPLVGSAPLCQNSSCCHLTGSQQRPLPLAGCSGSCLETAFGSEVETNRNWAEAAYKPDCSAADYCD